MNIYLLAILIFNFIDYFSTVKLLRLGAVELNPFMNYAIEHNLFPLIKLVLIPFLIFLLMKYRNYIINKILYKYLIILCFISYSLITIYHFYIICSLSKCFH